MLANIALSTLDEHFSNTRFGRDAAVVAHLDRAHEGAVTSIAFGGGRLATVGRDGRLVERDPVTLGELAVRWTHVRLLWRLVADPTGRSWWVGGVHGVIARAAWDGGVEVVRPPTWLWSPSAVVSVAPDGRTWARSTTDEIELLVGSEVVARTRVPHGATIVDHIFDPSGRRLVVMHWGTTIYTVPGLEVVAHLERHRAAAVFPDERLLARGHADGHVQLFDYATLTPIGPPILVGHGRIDNLAFTGDSTALYAGSYLGAVARIETDPASWLRLACDLAWGGLSPQEVEAVVGDSSLVADCGTS